ncbi:Zn-ribbon domain-containing OB-fold protein [Pseudonocardia xishanensis]|uniref:Zn-ribbon domain-containing OB-fold protein n=1 Tax=Pseudonocardia xishanensis TaxID=630995 RepID=A0ABP8RU76_9PSEU
MIRTGSTALPTPVPAPDPMTSEYWDAAAAGSLVLPRCRACREVFWYPRPHCPLCGADGVEYVPAVGRGVVYTFTVVRRAGGAWGEAAPYVLAMVTLPEGVTVSANIIDTPHGRLRIGLPVRAVFERGSADSPAVLRFTAAGAEKAP